MTQAAGFYNTLFQGDNPGIVVEVLNGYRLKERVPDNVGSFTVPLGVPEVLDRKSTRLNSSHSQISYAVFCLKKKKKTDLTRSHPLSIQHTTDTHNQQVLSDILTLTDISRHLACVAVSPLQAYSLSSARAPYC